MKRTVQIHEWQNEKRQAILRVLISSIDLVTLLRACSFCSQSIWIRWDRVSLNLKQFKIFHNFFNLIKFI
jgi:hypothetical protein